MRTIKYFLIVLVFTSCNKNEELPETYATPPSIVSGYHLSTKSVWGNKTVYNSSDKVLCFDSLTRKVTITGSKTDFYPNGIYPYRFYDTIIYITDPRTGKPIPQDHHLLYIKNFPAERLSVYERNKNTLFLNADESVDFSDDEVQYIFVYK